MSDAAGQVQQTRASSPARRADDRHPAKTGMPLLASKLAIPDMPSGLVSRPRLFALLDTGVRGRVSLVTGPAGAGKTMLLGSWLASDRPPWPVAWLTLDAGDNDPTRFWSYVLAALCRSGAVPADSVLQTLSPGPQVDEALLPLLAGGLEALPSPVVLVLDDVDELTDQTVLDGIEFLVRHAPPQLRLVLAGRTDPLLPLQRLLVSGALTQLRAAELAFTVAEVAELLADDDYRPQLSDQDLVLLQARTEGWATGLRLAALSLQRQPDPHRFVAELAGDDRSIADYLVTEVLERQPPELRAFLLRTCVVTAGERTLAGLERVGAFVVALGSRRDWYRYHALFVGLLRYELRRQAPHEVGMLHRRAASWYATHGRPVDAIGQAVVVEDWRLAADLIAEHGLGLSMRGQSELFRKLLGRLPAEAVRSNPELALLTAAEQITSHHGTEAQAWLQLAQEQQRLLPDDRRQQFALILALCRLTGARQAGDLDAVLAAGRELLALQGQAGAASGETDDDALAVTLSCLGTAELWTGDLAAAEAHLWDGHTAAVRAGLDPPRLSCLSQLAVLQAMRGRLGQAVQLGQAAVELAAERGWSSGRAAGAHLALGWVHSCRDDLPAAGRALDQAAAASQATCERPLAVATGIMQARLRHAQRDLAGSLAMLETTRENLAGWEPPSFLARWLAATEAELRIAAGDTESARVLVKGLLTDADEDGRQPAWDVQPVAWEAVALARLQLAEGDPAGASRSLLPFLDGATSAGATSAGAAPTGDPRTLVDAWLLDALAGDALDDADRAASSLGRALDLAEREGLRRPLLDASAPVRALLARHGGQVTSVWPFLDELLHGPVRPLPAVAAPMPVRIEPLSRREQVVLHYLPSMLTYREIAPELYISVNTLKSHVRSILRKLGVATRRDAVSRARQLKLLRS